jgi:hypothetical protein
MKKSLMTRIFSISATIAFSQSLSFKQILFVAKNGNADTYLKARGFTKGKGFDRLEAFVINAGTVNEEQLPKRQLLYNQQY